MKKMNIFFGFTAGLLIIGAAFAGNPILREQDQGFVYACDPAAEVFEGKVYVYCSHDQPDAENYESMKDYVILESADLKTWINHGVILDPQLAPGFEYAHSNMNAPDAAYKNGWYYWYFPSDITEVGVAKSRTPVGPWETAVSNEFTKIFDPTVFVDDDGQAYIYGNDHWEDIGDPGRHIMGAKLKDNMIELAGPWIRLSSEEVNEAVHVFKRNGIYYFNARVGKVTKYWMADSPLPHYAVLKGELAPSSPASPNHVSAIEFNKEWYLFYHRGDVNHGNSCRRSACFDKMTFRADGTIEPVVYTLGEGVEISSEKKGTSPRKVSEESAVVPLLKGSRRHQAEDFAKQSGVAVKVQQDGEKSTGLGNISNGDWSCYEKISFGNNAYTEIPFRVRVAAIQRSTIEVRLDSLEGRRLCTIAIPSTGGLDTFETVSSSVTNVAGVRTIYLYYTGDSGDLMNLNWFEWAPGKAKRIKQK